MKKFDKVKPAILCGGNGLRLWPLSTDFAPKQFLSLTGKDSMVAYTASRLNDPDLFSSPRAVGSVRYLSELRSALPNAQLILEPFGRDTAASVAATALTSELDDIILILPADHMIQNTHAFHSAIRSARKAAFEDYLVTLGVVPNYAATRYGYIKKGCSKNSFFEVDAFKEKPLHIDAKSYLKSGQYYWNAGIFVFKASAMIEAFHQYAPDILEATKQALHMQGSDFILSHTEFAHVRQQSIDYAILEKASKVAVVPVDMNWSDIGDFKSLAEYKTNKEQIVSEGPVISEDCSGSFFHSDGPVLVVRGLENTAIIASKNNILVTPLNDASNIKKLVKRARSSVPKTQLPTESRTSLLTWFFDRTLPHWLEHGYVDQLGFVEALNLAGEPLSSLKRRVRTVPRMIFTWSEALRFGFDPKGRSTELVKDGIAHLSQLIDVFESGQSKPYDIDINAKHEPLLLYDMSFMALALCSAYRALLLPEAIELSSRVFDLIDKTFWDSQRGGWNDHNGPNPKKLANPHMHYLEACLTDYEISFSEKSKNRIKQICELFEEHMFDARSGAVLEYFNIDWSVDGDREEQAVEPGHCYEWAFLLKEAERLSGRDLGSWRRRLIAFAEAHGVDRDGKVFDWVRLDGVSQAESYRLWPQLERLRALCHHPTPTSPDKLSQLVDVIRSKYLDNHPDGVWMDKIDKKGTAMVDQVPASVVYHLMTALTPLL